jgi:hypothetical protein
VYGIPTFEILKSFELELNGDASGGTSGSSFVQNPSVFLEIDHVSPHVHHKRTTLKH